MKTCNYLKKKKRIENILWTSYRQKSSYRNSLFRDKLTKTEITIFKFKKILLFLFMCYIMSWYSEFFQGQDHGQPYCDDLYNIICWTSAILLKCILHNQIYILWFYSYVVCTHNMIIFERNVHWGTEIDNYFFDVLEFN